MNRLQQKVVENPGGFNDWLLRKHSWPELLMP